MGDRTTRPHDGLRACRIRRYVVPFAQTGTAQVDRVIDGDTISVRLDVDRYTVRLTGVDDTPDAGCRTPRRRVGHPRRQC